MTYRPSDKSLHAPRSSFAGETSCVESSVRRDNEAHYRSQAQAFSLKWAGRGYEKGDTSSFWLELLSTVVGMEDVTTNVRFEQRTAQGGFIDVVIADAKTFIEQKSLGVDLDKPELRQGQWVTPFQQARNYANTLPNSQRPDFIIVCNFGLFRVHDLNRVDAHIPAVEFKLEELADNLHVLDFLTDPQRARIKREEKVSMDAGALVGKLYAGLRGQYLDPDSPDNQHALNVLCVRLVFCLFAEDAGLFRKDALFHYLDGVPPKLVRGMLKQLFEVLNTPPSQRDPYLSDDLKSFPYVNGGLFAVEEEIPPFTQDLLDLLVNEVSGDTNWAQISPTIFGGVFESTLNPETRAKGGMHYTSPENIHKVIDPLFLDGLRAELAGILESPTLTPLKRKNALTRFHNKIAGLTFFDPACGSGNFLTETYISLRRMENKILSVLMGDQNVLGFEDIGVTPLKVSLGQFYGIEINDFAVSVASTALWIAQLQANIETQTIITTNIEDLPLSDAAHIHHANALRTPWEEVLDPSQCNYIIGNPPFLGARNQSKEQKAEIKDVFPKGTKNVGNIDYVAGWYIKAAQYMGEHPVRAAFVSTNSICQGEQVANIWYPITQLGFHINFAHDTFRWGNEASDQAHVFCVIVGFSKQNDPVRFFHYAGPDAEPELQIPTRLNPYLTDAADVFVWNRSKPLCDVPKMGIGSQPIDDGNYLFSTEEKEEFLSQEPYAERFFHRFMGSREFIQGIDRWVLWLGEATAADFKHMPLARARVEKVREFRLASRRAQTKKAADSPHHFGTEIIAAKDSIVVPEVSSERRRYVPIGMLSPAVLCSNKIKLVPDATLFHFGILHSQFHNVWMRVVGGRLKSDYSYSSGIVYNNFIWPLASDEVKEGIAKCAQAVLDARKKYAGATLADMYDPDDAFLYPELVAAHKKLDLAVERAYGVDFSRLDEDAREQAIVAHLFELYSAAVGE